MKKFWKIILSCVLAFLGLTILTKAFIWVDESRDSYRQEVAKENAEVLFKQQKPSILWSGHNSNSFDVKIISYDKKGNTYFVGEEILSNVTWAKLVLQPTIGSMPTLLYMDDNSGQIKRIACSAAEIL